MKNILVILFLCIGSISVAQTPVFVKYNLVADTIKMEKYKPSDDENKEYKKVKLRMNYGNFEILNPKETEDIKNASIAFVDLVYTEFPKGEDFRQLNKKRLEYLHLICPSVFNNPITRWRIIGITKCNNEYEASQLFHGFVIYYLPGPTMATAKTEHDFLKNVMNGKEKLRDSTIIGIFKRNTWKNTAVVADFTGSMSPYIAQVLLWYNLTFASKLYTDFTFFNDGDMKMDDDKIICKTGGIYYCKSGNRDTILNTALCCVSNGCGGDAPENNIEAVLYTINKNPKLKEIILIVDNWAPMRDYALIDKIKIPVRVIVCGYNRNPYLNLQYLDLAYKTKGSLHTVEEDITTLMNINEGKTIEIGGETFKLSGGKFVRVKGV